MKLLHNRSYKQSVLLQLLIDEVKASKTFDMRGWDHNSGTWCPITDTPHPCGTAACLGGHLAHILERLGIKDYCYARHDGGRLEVISLVQLGRFIGLGNNAHSVFIPYLTADGVSYRAKKGQKGYISKKRAVTMLERFQRTNVVDWKL